ncbi:MAG: glutamate-ammonia-ligase adenylyltransferase, partial [Planctomycetota bacterium]
VQFLQLICGRESPAARSANTTEAMNALAAQGLLSMREHNTLSANYRSLRHLRHQMQGLFGPAQSHVPDDQQSLTTIAAVLGYHNDAGNADADAFSQWLDDRRLENRTVISLLANEPIQLNDPVPQSSGTITAYDDLNREADFDAAETDLILEPEPPTQQIESVLRPYGFQNPLRAARLMDQLADEAIPFLPSRRCRHLLARVSRPLLQEISQTPEPDQTLTVLAEMTNSIGGKSTLWELFLKNPATMRMVVNLAGAGRYLSNILIDHPGMIDDLIDSLLRHELPNAEQVDQLSIELCRGASELSSILHSFKASMHLMIGVHDLLGSADLSQTHSALASVADACIRRVVAYHHEQLASQYGDPVDAAGNPTQLVVLGLGRLGGREPNYHSDLDVMFLYSDDGNTQRRVGGPRQTTTNQHFFAELKQHVLQQFAAVRHAGGR